MKPEIASLSHQDWSLHRRGSRDASRHNEKVKESIRDNLQDLISDGSIITADPKSKKIIKIPMRSLELPRIKYKDDDEGVGNGSGNEEVGDIIGGRPGTGNGPGAGQEPGVEYYEAELSIEEIQEMVFADLGLPFMKPKAMQAIETEKIEFADVRKKKTPTHLDIYRTALANMERNARENGEAKIDDISPEDFRVRTWRQETREENSAVVIAMADVSGSMGETEKYLTRAFCWWTVNFLRSKYPKVEIVFIAHEIEAYEVTEEQFFSRGEGGGTLCSSANQLALDIIKKRYPPEGYNLYPLHFSDGDNWGDDNDRCIELVLELLDLPINQYAYVQVGRDRMSGLFESYLNAIDDERFATLMITNKQDVLPALKKIFNVEKE